jgi:hypothetical protein
LIRHAFIQFKEEDYARKEPPDQSFNLETEVGNDKLMQDFDLESLPTEEEHSRMGVYSQTVGTS